jgi:hypothetical protein
MGILDDAIRDHLELKRKGGAQEADLRRLESEAFGPSSRPGDAATSATATVEPPKTTTEPPQASAPEPEGATQVVPEQTPPPEPTPPEPTPPAPEPSPTEGTEPELELGPESEPASESGPVFHDFAAEEGLVAPRSEVAADPAPAEPAPAESAPAEPEPPQQEVVEPEGADDTQPHDMHSELGATEQPEEAPAGGLGPEEIDFEEELELELDEEDLEVSPEPNLTVVEEDVEDVEVVEEDVEIVEEEPAEEGGASEEEPSEAGDEGEGGEIEDAGEDVLEETPEFLRETPEHDRLWFEQKPPKDFDFEE